MHLPSFSSLKPLQAFLATTALLQAVFAADHGRRPVITPAAFLAPKRQAETCLVATDTLCPDGLGCCPNGEPCTYLSITIPVCGATCDQQSVYCEGSYSNVCCEAGSSCDYASQGLCTPGVFQFSSFSAPSIIVPSLTVPVFSSPSLPSVPSFTPFLPTSTDEFTAESSTDSSTEDSTSESSTSAFTAATGTASEVVVTVTPSSKTSQTATTTGSTLLVQSTGLAPNGPKAFGKGLLEVMVGGIGLLVGL